MRKSKLCRIDGRLVKVIETKKTQLKDQFNIDMSKAEVSRMMADVFDDMQLIKIRRKPRSKKMIMEIEW